MMINNVAFCHNSNVKINNSPVLSQCQMIAHLRSRSSESEYLASCEQLSTGPFSICNMYNVNSFAILHPGNDDVCIKQVLSGVTGDEDGDADGDDCHLPLQEGDYFDNKLDFSDRKVAIGQGFRYSSFKVASK